MYENLGKVWLDEQEVKNIIIGKIIEKNSFILKFSFSLKGILKKSNSNQFCSGVSQQQRQQGANPTFWRAGHDVRADPDAGQ